MAKLTKEQKIEIYNLRISGITFPELSLRYGVHVQIIKYLVRLIEYHGVDILRKDTNRYYSKSLKKQIIDEVLVLNNSVGSTAIEYGLSSVGMLSNWIKEYKVNGYVIVEKTKGRKSTMKKNIKKENKIKTSEELIKEQKEKILYLQAENEYLKKLHALMQQEERQQRKKK